MKHKLSISVDEETIVRIRAKLRERSFRNKSHLIEYAVLSYLEHSPGERHE